MNLIRKGHGHTHRGIIGVESAIVMIAFVIVAAALAFVVLNMGFSTTQKAKTTILSGLSEASSSLEVSGKVTGIGDISNAKLLVISFPIKVATGGDSVNLANTTATIKYLSNSVEYDNIYNEALTSTTYANVTLAFEQIYKQSQYFTANPVNDTAPAATKAIVYWAVQSNTNSILDQGEHAIMAIAYSSADQPSALDKLRTEIIVPTGAALTVERSVPNITNEVVDLG